MERRSNLELTGHLLEGDFSGVNKELQNAIALLTKRNKAIRFADDIAAGCAAVHHFAVHHFASATASLSREDRLVSLP